MLVHEWTLVTFGKVLSLLTISILLISVLFSVIVYLAKGDLASDITVTLPDYEPVDWQSGLAGHIEFPIPEGLELNIDMETFAATSFDASLPTLKEVHASGDLQVGTKVWDWYLWSISRNDYGGPKATMTLRALGQYCEIWVQDDLRFPFNETYNDPRNNYPLNFTITDEMCQYLAEVFDNIIYPTLTMYFGVPLDREGNRSRLINSSYPTAPENWWWWIPASGHGQRVIVKVLNYRDENYYNPAYPYYVAGFYSSSYTITYYDRNMVHLDCWQWWRRLGPAGKQWFSDRPDLAVSEDRANLYEATLAHEYQHLIHRDYNRNNPTWINEGCSDYAEMLCGWSHTIWGHVNAFLATPDNSLTVWNDQGSINNLADYGAAALFIVYLSDHYGGAELIRSIVTSGIPGIPGINAALQRFGYNVTFDDVFRDWRIANLIHSDTPGEGKYNYKSIDLGKPPARPIKTYCVHGLPVPPTKGTDFGNTITELGYDTGVSKIREYGTDYIVLRGWPEMGLITFDGEDGKNAIVTVIEAYVEKKGEIKYVVSDIELSKPVLTGAQRTFTLEPNYVILAISYTGAAGWSDYTFAVEVVPTLKATVVVNSNSLNLKSGGNWVTAYIELPKGYDVSNINVSTILVNFTIPVDFSAPSTMGDFDRDGTPDLMVKFNRAEIASFIFNNINIEDKSTITTLRITGYLTNGTPFQSAATIKIVLNTQSKLTPT